MAEDSKRGRAAMPKTRNRYGYCWNNPVGMVDLNGMEPEVPDMNSLLQPLRPQEETQFPEFVNPFETMEENKPASDFFDLEEYMSTIQAAPPEVIPEPVTAPVEEDYGDGITAKIREITKDWEGAFVFSTTGCLGDGLYTSGGYQLAIDWHGNVVAYPVYGTGAQAGSSAKLDFAIGYLDVPYAEKAKGFGTETGLSFGLFGIVPGISWITSNEDDGEFIGNGGMFHVGLGGNPTIIEVHTAMSDALEIPGSVKQFNIYDKIDEFWFWMESNI